MNRNRIVIIFLSLIVIIGLIMAVQYNRLNNSLETRKTNAPKIATDQEQFFKTAKVHFIENAHPIGYLPDNKIVFLEDNGSQNIGNNIFICEPDNFSIIKKVHSSNTKVIYDAQISGNWIVYVEAKNDMPKFDWDIFAIDSNNYKQIEVDNGKIAESDLVLETPTMIGPYLSASDGRIAYSTFEKDSNNLYVAALNIYDLKSSTKKAIDKIPVQDGEFSHPKIDGKWIIYDKGKIDVKQQGRFGTVILYNLNTKSRREIDSGMSVSSGSIKYPYIVWNSGRSILKLYNIENHETKVIRESSKNECWIPTLNQDYITWYDSSDELKVYSIAQQKIITIRQSGVTNGGIINNNILWWPEKGSSTPISYWINLK